MRIQLTSISKLPAARRMLRPSGIRLTVRYGQIYTIRAVQTHQPNSQAQLRMRNIMAQAAALAKKELATPARRQYWTIQATRLGYKTARGACIAHHIHHLRTIDLSRHLDGASTSVDKKQHGASTSVDKKRNIPFSRHPRHIPHSLVFSRLYRFNRPIHFSRHLRNHIKSPPP